jgi:hypothetical protein
MFVGLAQYGDAGNVEANHVALCNKRSVFV